jgi:hypothetical protein
VGSGDGEVVGPEEGEVVGQPVGTYRHIGTVPQGAVPDQLTSTRPITASSLAVTVT